MKSGRLFQILLHQRQNCSQNVWEQMGENVEKPNAFYKEDALWCYWSRC